MNPTGLCECGCGQRTNLAERTVPALGYVTGKPYRFLVGHCRRGAPVKKGSANPTWRGPRIIAGPGYVYAEAPGHPRARGGRVPEHVLIAERALGKRLPVGAIVHHADGNKTNNLNSNLVVCQDSAYHSLLHQRMRAKAACGNPNFRKCTYCKRWSDTSEMRMEHQQKGKVRFVHYGCYWRKPV